MDRVLPLPMLPTSSTTGERSVSRGSVEFDAIVTAEKDRMYTFAYYYLGSSADAEDVVQESFIKLWKHLAEIEGPCAAWLHRVVRNACFDRLRRRKTVKKLVEPDADPHLVAEDTPGPGERLQERNLKQLVREHISSLPEPYRTAVVLREIQEFAYREIAEHLEQPVNTVKTHVHRGKRMLRESLRDDRAWSSEEMRPKGES